MLSFHASWIIYEADTFLSCVDVSKIYKALSSTLSRGIQVCTEVQERQRGDTHILVILILSSLCMDVPLLVTQIEHYIHASCKCESFSFPSQIWESILQRTNDTYISNWMTSGHRPHFTIINNVTGGLKKSLSKLQGIVP